MKHKRDFKRLRNLPLIFSTPELLQNLYNLGGWQKFPWINLKKPIESRFNLQGYNFTWKFSLGIFQFFIYFLSNTSLTFGNVCMRMNINTSYSSLWGHQLTSLSWLILSLTLHGPVKATNQYPVKHVARP